MKSQTSAAAASAKNALMLSFDGGKIFARAYCGPIGSVASRLLAGSSSGPVMNQFTTRMIAEDSRNEEIISSASHCIRNHPDSPAMTADTARPPAAAARPPRKPFAWGRARQTAVAARPPA